MTKHKNNCTINMLTEIINFSNSQLLLMDLFKKSWVHPSFSKDSSYIWSPYKYTRVNDCSTLVFFCFLKKTADLRPSSYRLYLSPLFRMTKPFFFSFEVRCGRLFPFPSKSRLFLLDLRLKSRRPPSRSSLRFRSRRWSPR